MLVEALVHCQVPEVWSSSIDPSFAGRVEWSARPRDCACKDHMQGGLLSGQTSSKLASSKQEAQSLTRSPSHLPRSSSPFPYPPHDRGSDASKWSAALPKMSTQGECARALLSNTSVACRVCARTVCLMCHEEICTAVTACAYSHL